MMRPARRSGPPPCGCRGQESARSSTGCVGRHFLPRPQPRATTITRPASIRQRTTSTKCVLPRLFDCCSKHVRIRENSFRIKHFSEEVASMDLRRMIVHARPACEIRPPACGPYGARGWGTGELSTQHSALRTQDSGLSTQHSGLRTQDSGLRTQDSGLRTQDSGLRTQDSGLRT